MLGGDGNCRGEGPGGAVVGGGLLRKFSGQVRSGQIQRLATGGTCQTNAALSATCNLQPESLQLCRSRLT